MFDISPVLERANDAVQRNLSGVLNSGQFIHGQQVRTLEQELSNAFGGAHAVGAGSGTAALELCLRDLGVTEGQDVIVPANTSLFTAQAVLAAGARIRFADVDPRTLQLTAQTAAAAWTERTAAVIGVHLYGNACPVDQLAELCRERNVALVQDACQAHGLRYKGLPLTSFSPYTAYSFYPTKNLGCLGDGGAVVTNSQAIAKSLRLLGDGGREHDQWARVPAINSRLDEMHAAYLRAFLPHLEYWNGERRRVAAVYDESLRDVREIAPVGHSGDSVHHLYVIRSTRREELRSFLSSVEIDTGVHYPHPLHEHPAFAANSSWAAEPAEAMRASKEIVSLPIGPHVTEDDARRVAEQIRRFFL
ncbi:MAG: DegT/DnrJ/EryC1/StrS family aminotransferase [Bryobacteraceae bacterium]